jgi:cardiolipin synthase
MPQDLARYCSAPSQMRYGYSCEILLGGGPAFAAMLRAIDAARDSVWLESYIFDSDATGKRFIDRLCAAAERGVEVLVLLDAFGALGLDSVDEIRLVQSGAFLRYYGRFNHFKLERWLERDHRKQVIVDGERAFVGGINFNDDYAPIADGGRGWHDLMVEMRGPAILDLQDLFLHNWNQLGLAAEATIRAGEPAGEEWGMVVASNRKIRLEIRRHLLHAIRNAEREVIVASAYFVPDRGILRALGQVARRGVDVRVLVPAESDIRSAQWAGEYSYSRLLRNGVTIHPWLGTHMHAKALVVDDRFCAFGSYNLDYVSLFMNLELLVVVAGDTTPKQLAEQLRNDCLDTPSLALQTWKARPAHHRLRSWFAYQFRKIL